MNRILFGLMLLIMALISGHAAFAGSLDYHSNQSVKYNMTMTRNGSTDASADVSTYNPAGMALIPEGFYIDFSNQALFLMPYRQDTDVNVTTAANSAGVYDKDLSQEQNRPTYIFPNLYAAWNCGRVGEGRLALFAQAGVIGGGATLDWDSGTAGTTVALTAMSLKAATLPMGAFVAGDISSQSFTAMSVYYGFGLGCAYSFFDDIISLSLGGRYVMARRYIELDVAFASGDTISGKYTYNAYGFTPIAGLNIRPVKDLNIGFRYEYETALKFRYKEENFSASNGTLGAVARGVLANAGIKDGNSFNYNLPQTFGMGVEYSLTPEIALMTSVNISLLSLADMGKVYDSGSGAAVCELNDYCGTGWELSLGAIWKPVKELKIGTGFLLTEMGLKDSYFDNQYTLLNASANPPLDCIGMTLGANWIMENLGLDFTVVCSWIHYLPRDYEFTARGATAGAIQDVSGTYKKDVVNLGLGLGYKV